MSGQNPNEFERANQEPQAGIVKEFVAFLRENKKFWLIPLLLALLAIGAILLSSPAAAPFIYTLF